MGQNWNRTQTEHILEQICEPFLIQLDDAKVASIVVRSSTNANWGCPDNVSDHALPGLAPALLNVLIEGLDNVDISAARLEFGHENFEVILRLWEAHFILHVGCEPQYCLLSSFGSVNDSCDMRLDRG